MLEYKRNQVEEAISHLLEPTSPHPTQTLRTKVKRLLEADRALQAAGDANGGKFAFFSAEPPGRGVEIWFSSYEALALLTGLRLMAHGWPQGQVVSVMRSVRSVLEEEHRRILRHDPNWLFDQQAILKNARPGDHAFDNQDPLLLTIVSGATDRSGQGASPACKICRGPVAAHAFFHQVSAMSGALTLFELTTSAHRLAGALAKTEPLSRGRGH